MYKLPVVYWVNSILNNTADTLSVRDFWNTFPWTSSLNDLLS